MVKKLFLFFKESKKAFGTPLALVWDMGKGISNAILEVFPHTRDFICHYHFLRDIGKDLFGKENDTIRTSLKQYGIQGLLRKMASQFKKVIDTNPDILDCFAVSLNVEKIEERAMEQIPQVTAYAMIQWALEGKKQGNGYGFPFDSPYLVFYQRLVQIYSQCESRIWICVVHL